MNPEDKRDLVEISRELGYEFMDSQHLQEDAEGNDPVDEEQQEIRLETD